MPRKHVRAYSVVMSVLLVAACTDGDRAEPTTTGPTTTVKPPAINTAAQPTSDLDSTIVREVVDGRTVVLGDGRRVRIAGLAAPADCWAAGAVAFAATMLLGKPVLTSPTTSDASRVLFADGTDYALLAVGQGIVRSEVADAGFAEAEKAAARADLGLWGPPCDGQNAPRTSSAPAPPVPTQPVPTQPAKPAPAVTCAVRYRLMDQWPGGFEARVTITNTGTTAIKGWALQWTFDNGQTVSQMWDAVVSQTGTAVNAANAPYDPVIGPGRSVSLGFTGTRSGTNTAPRTFTLNGAPCKALV